MTTEARAASNEDGWLRENRLANAVPKILYTGTRACALHLAMFLENEVRSDEIIARTAASSPSRLQLHDPRHALRRHTLSDRSRFTGFMEKKRKSTAPTPRR